MIVRACVPVGEALALDDFLTRMWERFGIVAGGRRSDSHGDAEVLARHGLHVDAGALEANTELLVIQLTAMGLARRYADNVAFVGDPDAV